MFPRDRYLQQLIRKMNNGKIKIVTGLRRSGKTVLLNNLFYDYLISQGIMKDHIILLSLEDYSNARYRNPLELDAFIRSLVAGKDIYYIILDEVQNVVSIKNPWINDSEAEDRIGFVDVLLGLMKIQNVDLYVTGSNSKMLSSDVLTQFRDRGDEIHVNPLSFKEFYEIYGGDKFDAWREYYTYGGLPRILEMDTHREKADYLRNLFMNTYLKDVMERHNIRNEVDVLTDLLNILASSIGSLTNPNRLSNTFRSEKHKIVSSATIKQYITYFIEAYLIEEAKRYDVKGKKYIDTPLKYYFTDLGLRNSWLNFSQLEENHIMENVLYNELILRGYSVDVGLVEYRFRDANDKQVRSQYEVDFIARSAGETYYIQSSLHLDTPQKQEQEIRSLTKINDSFKKIVIIKDHIMPYRDSNGILYMGLMDFLLDEESLKK